MRWSQSQTSVGSCKVESVTQTQVASCDLELITRPKALRVAGCDVESHGPKKKKKKKGRRRRRSDNK